MSEQTETKPHQGWDEVWGTESCELHRMVVPGGWLYRFVSWGSSAQNSIAFVPTPATLVDAHVRSLLDDEHHELGPWKIIKDGSAVIAQGYECSCGVIGRSRGK